MSWHVAPGSLYAEEPDDLRKFLSSSQSNNQFRHKNSTFWVNLIRDQFINQKKIVLKGKPSRAKVEELTEKEERRIEKQIQDLGPAGLARKQQELEMAIESQKLPGREVLEKIALGTVESIQFRSILYYYINIIIMKIFLPLDPSRLTTGR